MNSSVNVLAWQNGNAYGKDNNSLSLDSDTSPRAAGRFSPPNMHKIFWVAIMERLQEGKHVLHADVDAILVHDVWPSMIVNQTDMDVVVPQQEGWPSGCDFIPNTGFILYRNTKSTNKMIDDIVAINDEQLKNWKPRDGRRQVLDEQSRLCKYIKSRGTCKRDIERRDGYARQANVGDPKGRIGIAKCGDISFGCHWPPILRGHGDCTKGEHCMYNQAVVHGKGNLAGGFCPHAKMKGPWG